MVNVSDNRYIFDVISVLQTISTPRFYAYRNQPCHYNILKLESCIRIVYNEYEDWGDYI